MLSHFDKLIQTGLLSFQENPSKNLFLKNLRSEGMRYTDFLEILSSNPSLEKQFLTRLLQQLPQKGPVEEPPSLVTALSWVGLTEGRNLLATLFCDSSLHYAKIAEALPFPFRAQLFLGGLVFDIFKADIDAGSLTSQQALPKLWDQSLQTSCLALQFLESFLSVPHAISAVDLFLDGLFHHLGFLSPPSLPHPAAGFFLIDQFEVLGDYAKVALYHHEPFLAQRMSDTLGQRAFLIWLADEMLYFSSHRWKAFKNPPVVTWTQLATFFFPGVSQEYLETSIRKEWKKIWKGKDFQ